MGFRFSKRIKIAPGVRLNLGTRGVSVSAGVRGASLTLGKNGLHGSVGLPGTGLSYRTRLASGGGARSKVSEAERRRERSSELEAEAARCNAQTWAAFEVHRGSPPPAQYRTTPTGFSIAKPERPCVPDGAPGEPRPDVWTRYAEALAAWRAAKANHDQAHSLTPQAREQLEDGLKRRLAALPWPRETLVAFEISTDGALVRFDVDLPEIEDLPAAEFRVDRSSLAVVTRPVPQTTLRSRYARHVHAALFRVLAEAFAAIPCARAASAAGFTQRASSEGAQRSVYILEVHAQRDRWSSEADDPVLELERHTLNRRMSARGALAPVSVRF